MEGRSKSSVRNGDERNESRREHDFYRYFEPIRHMTDSGPAFCNVRDARAREQHKPFSCPDKTLTAFCQLGAFRLNVRRCLLFFFDVESACVLAEATRSLSLEDDSVHDPGDQLWLGHASIPRNVACCEITINLPAFPPRFATSPETERESVYMVNDLTQNPYTKNQPYVTNYPYARFYAGVPITSPAGINIGAYCVLDDNPREGFSERDMSFMRDMSRTVMTHLETLRARSERQRVAHMVTGLGAFVQGASDARRWERRIAKRRARTGSSGAFERSNLPTRKSERVIQRSVPDALSNEMTSAQHLKSSPGPKVDYFDTKIVEGQSGTERFWDDHERNSIAGSMSVASSTPEKQSSPPLTAQSTRSTFDDKEPNRLEGAEGDISIRMRRQSAETVVSLNTPKIRKPPSRTEERLSSRKPDSSTNDTAYQRASEIMCESLSVDGVVFVDASVGTFGGLTDAIDAVDGTEMSTFDDSDSTLLKSNPESPTSGKITPKSCQVLGSAMSVHNDRTYEPEQHPAMKMTEGFLRTILRRHPCGKIWTFDRQGVTHSEDLVSSDNEELDDPSAHQRQIRRKESQRDGEMLQAMFPSARTICTHGIRDQKRRRFTAGCILWSYDPLRVLTTNTEMNFVAAFCDIIIGENKRLEAQRSDKAKSDFISSISQYVLFRLHKPCGSIGGASGWVHLKNKPKTNDVPPNKIELRSPLHGILGSTEVLKENDLDSMAMTLVEQTDSCARTLLSIIDDLLDFAKIRGERLMQGSASSSRIARMMKGRRGSTQSDIADLDLSIALDEVTEEVLESTVYSYFCKKSVEERARVTVILDINRSSPDIAWGCALASGGWRRICINLVNNALKYTESGFVHITMDQKRKSRQRFEAVLTIADSGKGMSKAFVDEDLFRDFTQEDTNSEGMGLGMNMVGRIIHAMGGSIKVVSDQKGSGTTITVSVPLERGQNQDRSESTESLRTVVADSLKGLPVGILLRGYARQNPIGGRAEQLEITASTLAISSIEKTCAYLGLETRTGTWADCDATNLNFVLEEDFANEVRRMQDGFDNDKSSPIARVPSIVICKNSPSAETVVESWRNDPHYLGIVTEYIASPCSVRTISRAISSALRRHKEYKNPPKRQLHASDSRKLPTWVRTGHNADDHLATEIDQLNGQSTSASHLTSSSLEAPEPLEKQSSMALISNRTQTTSITQEQMPDDREKSPAERASESATQVIESPVLLLVDDNKVNLQLLVGYAKKRKYSYLTAYDGQVALDTYVKAHEDSMASLTPGQRPTIVIMDINMPVMDGYESTQRIRSYEKKHHLPPSRIIALTALGSAAAHKEAFGSGFDLFMTKPVKLKSLTQIIESESWLEHGPLDHDTLQSSPNSTGA